MLFGPNSINENVAKLSYKVRNAILVCILKEEKQVFWWNINSLDHILH